MDEKLYEGLPEALQDNYQQHIQLDKFEGPLDLLLYLIKREELDIYNIPIAHITQQYLCFLKNMKEKAIDIAGEFFVMASTLMLIKSRMLLPSDKSEDLNVEESPAADPRWDLIEQLIEYKKYKEAAEALQTCITQQYHYWPREVSDVQPKASVLASFSSEQLVYAFSSLLLRLKERLTVGSIKADAVTVADRISWVLMYLAQKSRFVFQHIWAQWPDKSIIAVTFLAILELNRLKEIAIEQKEPFGAIEIFKQSQ